MPIKMPQSRSAKRLKRYQRIELRTNVDMSHYVTVTPQLLGELVESGCIIYIGPGNGNGYGVKRVQGLTTEAENLPNLT